MERARRRLGKQSAPMPRTRGPRSDRGRSRLDPEVLACVTEALTGQERPRTREILAEISRGCRARALEPPSRATVYKLMAGFSGPAFVVGDLPPEVQAALYNLTPESEVPPHQIAFACFNHGDLRAVSFAAGLPWLAIHQALRLREYRKKSRGLLEAVARVRGI